MPWMSISRFSHRSGLFSARIDRPIKIIIEHQSAFRVIQDPNRLLIQFFQPDGGGLGIIHQQDQNRIDRGQDEPDVGGYSGLFIAFMLEPGSHHDIADGQEHTDKVGSKGEIGYNENSKKEYRNGYNGCADFGNGSVHMDLLYILSHFFARPSYQKTAYPSKKQPDMSGNTASECDVFPLYQSLHRT